METNELEITFLDLNIFITHGRDRIFRKPKSTDTPIHRHDLPWPASPSLTTRKEIAITNAQEKF